jgi:hypothetical protein
MRSESRWIITVEADDTENGGTWTRLVGVCDTGDEADRLCYRMQSQLRRLLLAKELWDYSADHCETTWFDQFGNVRKTRLDTGLSFVDSSMQYYASCVPFMKGS